jgi:hypothetical protein
LILVSGARALSAPEAETCPGSCPGSSCVFDGLRNDPLGAAVLSITPACALRADDIGSTGLDGVAQVDLDSLYMAMTLAQPNFSLSAAGTRANIRQIGVVEQAPGQDIMLTQLVNYDGAHVRQIVTCDTLGSVNYVVRIYSSETLVEEQDHGLEPPAFSYPRADVAWMGCGIMPNGELYAATELGSPQAITVLDWPDPGPFTGNLIFVQALSPDHRADLQERIDETFAATGPVEITAMAALAASCPPAEIGGVAAEEGSPTRILFDSMENLTGPSTSYRVVTGRLSQLPVTSGFSQAVCLGTFPDSPALDGRPGPPPGDGYYYLIRGRSLCPSPRRGTYGDSTVLPDPRDKLDKFDPCGGA